MSNHAVANRYAVALFQLAKEQGKLEQVSQELEVVKEVITQTPEFLETLEHPKVSADDKKQLVKESFSQLSDTVLNALLLLLEKRRVSIISAFAEEFQALSDEEQDVARATVYSVKPLTDDEKKMLSEGFAKKVGKKTLDIENAVDKDLIGGIKIRIGDQIFDGSVKGQLDRIERELISGKR